MKTQEFQFSQKKVNCLFDATFTDILNICKRENALIITDEEVFRLHHEKWEGFNVFQIKAGEKSKNQQTIDRIIDFLIQHETGKQDFIIGVGGGVVTDIAGYVASIYKRGTKLGFVPTSILGMVDAAIGGKNGIDIDIYKNMVGTIYQPDFILYDYSFLDTLPVKEWINGFAEVIKHACIKDAVLFGMLERYNLHEVQSDKSLIADLIERNATIKFNIVTRDEFEKGERKLLNFGHSFGHAIENLHQLPHGHAVSIGMVAACTLSEEINSLHFSDALRVVKLLAKYHLPVDIETDHQKVFDILKQDKKRENEFVHFVLLNKIGDALSKPVALEFVQAKIKTLI
jgi:3-dehydroquinate synthase